MIYISPCNLSLFREKKQQNISPNGFGSSKGTVVGKVNFTSA